MSSVPPDAIARRLDLSPKTVRNHISNILLKIGAEDRVAAALVARQHGYGPHV